MSRLLTILIGSLFILALAIPAMAEVDVYANIYKDKDVIVVEEITKTKDVDIDVTVDIEPVKAAEAWAIGNQVNTDNYACENCAEKASVIWDSVNENSGLTNINQSSGNMNNQGIAISVALDVSYPNGQEQPEGGGFAEAQASVEQDMVSNVVYSEGILWRIADINNSINDNTGVTNVNQAVGNMNNQMTAIALAVSLAGGVALSEADLGQANANNIVLEFDVTKSDSITGSVNGNTGITTVNQSCGNMNNQANVVSVAGAVSF